MIVDRVKREEPAFSEHRNRRTSAPLDNGEAEFTNVIPCDVFYITDLIFSFELVALGPHQLGTVLFAG